MYLILSDHYSNSTPYEFSLTISNSAPKFSGKKPADQKVQLNKELNYKLPSMVDAENNPITVVTIQPNFIKFDSNKNSFKISPTYPSDSIGIFNVKGYMTDTKLQSDFDFKVEVYNTPPKF
jgi:hypothetical protein